MAIVLFDTNILIDHTLGFKEATAELAGYDDAAISAISWIETSCKLTPEQIAVFDTDLANAGIVVVQTTPAIMRRAGELRRQSLKKVPDCLIRATAEIQGRIVVTRNPIDFGGRSNAQLRIPYRLENEHVTDVQPLPP